MKRQTGAKWVALGEDITVSRIDRKLLKKSSMQGQKSVRISKNVKKRFKSNKIGSIYDCARIILSGASNGSPIIQRGTIPNFKGGTIPSDTL